MRVATTKSKNATLHFVSQALRMQTDRILEANQQDILAAQNLKLSEAMLDRLALNLSRIESMAKAVEKIAAMPDPIGRISNLTQRPSGISVGRMQVPIGVIAMIYESRPNVTIDAAALCLKSGNAVILKGGSEAKHSNACLSSIVCEALKNTSLPIDACTLLPFTEREATQALIGLNGLVDVVIPRGGQGLIDFVAQHARVPIIAHYQGVCHLFVDAGSDIEQAIQLVIDGKAKRPGVCNALETLLVHESMAPMFLPALMQEMVKHGVEVRADAQAHAFMPLATVAQEGDFGHEFLAKILAVRVLPSFDAALDHVARYGSNHTEAILTPSYEHAERWLHEVDASCVLVNASTRFNDGGELGLGAELGIATSKLHAYGPMGLDELTTRKWIVYGHGQVREPG